MSKERKPLIRSAASLTNKPRELPPEAIAFAEQASHDQAERGAVAAPAPAPASVSAPAAPAAVARQTQPPVAAPTPAPTRPGGPIEVSTAEELNDAMAKVLGGTTTNAGNTAVPASDSTSGDGYSWYTVKENDTLWGIAAENLGAGSKLTLIQELNKELLKDKVTVHPGQKLRLPAKQVPSAGQ